jgi:hypothetical protein
MVLGRPRWHFEGAGDGAEATPARCLRPRAAEVSLASLPRSVRAREWKHLRLRTLVAGGQYLNELIGTPT